MTFTRTKYYKILENITIFFGTDEEEEEEEEEEEVEEEERDIYIYTITEALFRPREAL